MGTFKGLRVGATTAVLILLTIFSTVQISQAQSSDSDAEANSLFVEAVALYRQATSGAGAADDLAEVRRIFDDIVSRFPESRPADLIRAGGSPAGVELATLPPSGWNDAKRAIARDLLAAYRHDQERMKQVAANIEWAVLACAAHSDDGTTCHDNFTGRADVKTVDLGWTPITRYTKNLLAVGQGVAFLYEDRNGRFALAFRGTDEKLADNITNILGSADPTFLNTAQLEAAVNLASETAMAHPGVTFVGYSLGGRLAQIGALATGRPAVVFNSAPLGVWETLRYKHKMAQRTVLATRFRAPEDPISILGAQDPAEQIEVSNIPRTDDVYIQTLSGAIGHGYVHSMGVLAGAMQDVADAENAGWIDAYLAEKANAADGPSISPPEIPLPGANAGSKLDFGANESEALSEEWGPGILPPPGAEIPYVACSGARQQEAFRSCLVQLGYGEEAVAFLMKISGEDLGNYEVIDFKELGVVDLASVEWTGAGAGEMTYLLNGSLGEYILKKSKDFSGFTDQTSRQLLAELPNASVGSGFIVSHRRLSDGTQRFVYSESITNGCRACELIALTYEFLEVGPATGGLLKRRPIGIGYRVDGGDLTPALIVQYPEISQSMLNLQGYDAGPMDGVLGPRSATAFTEFQREHCLPVTGQLDFATATELLESDGFAAPKCDANRLVAAGATSNATATPTGVPENYPPIGQSPDLFNTFANLLWGNCDSGCSYQGVTGNFTVTQLTQAEAAAQVASTGCEMIYEQSVPQCAPSAATPAQLTGEYHWYRVTYTTCTASACPAGIFAILWPQRMIAARDNSYSGLAGVAYDTSIGAIVKDVPSDGVAGSQARPDRAAASVPENAAYLSSPSVASLALVIEDLSSGEIAGLLRAAGVTPENSKPTFSEAAPDKIRELTAATEAEIAENQARFSTALPEILSPEFVIDATYDRTSGQISICSSRDIAFLGTNLRGVDRYRSDPPALRFVPRKAILGFASMPIMCNINNDQAVNAFEAKYGRGNLKRYPKDTFGNLAIQLDAEPSIGERIAAASAEGRARGRFECRLEFRTHQSGRASEYDHNRIATCMIDRMQITLHDPENNQTERIVFDGSGQTFAPMGPLVVEATASSETSNNSRQTPPFERAVWSFDTEKIGADAVAEIVDSFKGQPIEAVLGYQNAFPFATRSDKRLAVSVFQQLPKDEIDTTPGTEMGHGSYVVKNWSGLKNWYFEDEPSPGKARVVLGIAEDVRILSVKEKVGSSCEWGVTYRIWLQDKTPFGTALETASGSDGLTFSACFRTTRTGFDIAEYSFVDN